MKILIISLLACASVLGAETDLRVISTAQTNAEKIVVAKDTFTRDGQTNLIRITKIAGGAVLRICHFYHAGQVVGNFVELPEESTFNTEASPFCMSLKYGPAGEIRSARIGDKEGRLLDEFTYANGVFSPVAGPLRQNGLMKPKFGSEHELARSTRAELLLFPANFNDRRTWIDFDPRPFPHPLR